MKRHGIQHFASESEQQTAVIERFNEIIKTRIWTYLSDRGTMRWLDVIQDLVDAYNHSCHRSIGIAPADVQKSEENCLLVRLFKNADIHLSLQFRKEPWCGPAATRQFLTKVTCQTVPKSTLQWVRKCHLEKGTRATYISWWTTTMMLLLAAGTQRSYRKFQTTRTALRKFCEGVLNLTAQKNYLSGGKVGQQSRTRG